MGADNRYATLDGLRGIAAVAIMFLHTAEFTLNKTISSAGSAVDFFFLLSGFVLSAAYPSPGGRYALARVVRLYPMMLFGVVLGAALMLTTGLTGAWRAALALNLAGLPFPGIQYAFDHPLWSIAVEAELSVLFIVLARLWTPALLIAVCAAMIAATVLRSIDPVGLFARGALPFASGVLIYRARGQFSGPSIRPIAAAIVLVCLLGMPGIQLIPITRTAAFAVVLLLAISDPPAGLRPICDYLGRLSYPLYAVHWPIGWWANHNGVTGTLGFAAVCVAAVFIAQAALVFYDGPVRRTLSRIVAVRAHPATLSSRPAA